MKKFSKSFVLIIFFLLGLSLYLGYEESSQQIEDMPYSCLIQNIANNNIKEVAFQNSIVFSLDKQNKKYKTNVDGYSSALLSKKLSAKKEILTYYTHSPFWIEFLKYNFVHLLTMALFLFLILNKMPEVKNKFKVKLNKNFTFDDIAGAEEAKEELFELIDFLKNPKKFLDIGAKIPKGVILDGPPGVGKTLLAKAVASEANCSFFYASGSQFEEMYVGLGASRVRSLFEEAKNNSPCIIFIDEVDCLAQRRNRSLSSVGDQTLNELLTQLDGFETKSGVIVIGATNRLSSIDKALLRPGRLGDRIVKIDLPSMKQREAILQVHAKKIKLDDSVNLTPIAKRTFGFSGADLANIINEAAILAAKHNEQKVSQQDLLQSTEKVHLGPKSKTHIMNDAEKERTAYHEAAHAITAKAFDKKNNIHQITILPRANALGYVTRIPAEEKDSYSKTKKDFLNDVKVALAGYASEELIYGKDNVSSGPSNDLYHATDILRKIIMYYGMGSIGMMSCYHDPNETPPLSNDTLKLIEDEVNKLLEACYKQVATLLIQNKNILTSLKDLLLLNETLNTEEIDAFFETNILQI